MKNEKVTGTDASELNKKLLKKLLYIIVDSSKIPAKKKTQIDYMIGAL